MAVKTAVIPVERIEKHIFLIRGEKVMLSTHLAELYDVEPRALVQAVKRNIERFPEDFMFQLRAEEFANLKSQTVISSYRRADARTFGKKRPPQSHVRSHLRFVISSSTPTASRRAIAAPAA